VSSEHFVLYTESWFLTYRYVLDRLEDSHDAIARLFFSGAEADRVEVLLLSGGDYEALLNNTRDGVFVTPSPAAGGLVIMRAVGLRQRLDATAVHELVHRLIAAKHPSMPPWLNEGIATYLQTLKVDDDELEVGRLLTPRASRTGSRPVMPLHQLVATEQQRFAHDDESELLYHSASEFVRWLLRPQGPGPLLERWGRLVAPYAAGATVDESPEQIAARVFPGLPGASPQASVQSYTDSTDQSSRYPIWFFPFKPRPRNTLRAVPVDADYLKRLCRAASQTD
jgi:hypothetical protein